MIAAWLLAILATPPDYLAPSVADLDRSLERVDRLLDAAAGAEAQWSEGQRAWVEAGCSEWACPLDQGMDIAGMQGDAARAMRERAQSARAEWMRARRILAFEAVGPLVGEARRREMDRLKAGLERISVAYTTRRAWHARYVERWTRAYRHRMKRRACEPAP